LRFQSFSIFVSALLLLAGCQSPNSDSGFVTLFPQDGTPQDWMVRAWDDVSKQPAQLSAWKVVDGVLFGSEPRGTWLVSEKEYSDFILRFEWRLGERGNSGCGLRFPGKGDPAFDGLELQMADNRYTAPDVTVNDHELTGSFYRALSPSQQLYRPLEWNRYEISCVGSKILVRLNGVMIQDVDLETQEIKPQKHDGTLAPPLKLRPRSGHIGFQELSRGGGHVEIRNAEIKVLH
jgi:hypothetical protein